uniref:Uncharacterized protein n=1 Tax=Romanomermis culicivorax TaxID=13658 RepID=A0A915HMK0_ROMCU
MAQHTMSIHKNFAIYCEQTVVKHIMEKYDVNHVRLGEICQHVTLPTIPVAHPCQVPDCTQLIENNPESPLDRQHSLPENGVDCIPALCPKMESSQAPATHFVKSFEEQDQ